MLLREEELQSLPAVDCPASGSSKKKRSSLLSSAYSFLGTAALLLLLLFFLAFHVREVVQKAGKANRLEMYAKKVLLLY